MRQEVELEVRLFSIHMRNSINLATGIWVAQPREGEHQNRPLRDVV